MGALLPAETPGRRVVVVSPHLDDGVLSLGAAIAAWSRAGARVELLTVLGCDPASEAPAGGWDRRGGFGTEGASARARREEDRRACAILGATPVWLPFGSVDYERHGDEDGRPTGGRRGGGRRRSRAPPGIAAQPPRPRVARADARRRRARRGGGVALYAEQPYTRRAGAGPQAPPWLASAVGPSTFAPVPARLRDRHAKWRAIRCYRSQLPLLGMGRSLRRGPHRLALAPELVAWRPD